MRQQAAAYPPQEMWDSLEPRRWPAFFRLLDIAADLPRLAEQGVLQRLPAVLWPELTKVSDDLIALQRWVDLPVVPAQSIELRTAASPAQAAAELVDLHLTNIDFLFAAEQRAEIERQVAGLAAQRGGSWGELDRTSAPQLWDCFAAALGSDIFRQLTGFDLARGEFSITLSLQDLQPAGIGWHRDLYWPREWVGRDVFALFYALGADRPEKGGAFVHYVPWRNQIFHFYRQRHQATVLWNSRHRRGRLLHAVSGYRGADTSRHLIIVQCLRQDRSRA